MLLSGCGMSGITECWVKSWLKGRAQRVIVNEATWRMRLLRAQF